MSDQIEITEKDFPEHLSKFKETSDVIHALVDVERGLWVSFGVPVKDKDVAKPEIMIPNEPHVFMAHEMWVSDLTNDNLLLQNVPVIFAHGYRDGGTWKFANGQPVVDTVSAYDEYARLNNLPQIEFVMACNQDRSENPLGIQIKDFPEGNVVAQAVGKTMYIKMGHDSFMSAEGKVVITVGLDNDVFWGLSELSDVKQIGNRIKLT